jgi:hypothetical protein
LFFAKKAPNDDLLQRKKDKISMIIEKLNFTGTSKAIVVSHNYLFHIFANVLPETILLSAGKNYEMLRK